MNWWSANTFSLSFLIKNASMISYVNISLSRFKNVVLSRFGLDLDYSRIFCSGQLTARIVVHIQVVFSSLVVETAIGLTCEILWKLSEILYTTCEMHFTYLVTCYLTHFLFPSRFADAIAHSLRGAENKTSTLYLDATFFTLCASLCTYCVTCTGFFSVFFLYLFWMEQASTFVAVIHLTDDMRPEG